MTNRTEPHITTPEQLRSMIKATREYLDHLESASYFGEYWVGFDEQKELAGMECELDMVLVNESHLLALLDGWEDRYYRERRAMESVADSYRTDGIADMGGS